MVPSSPQASRISMKCSGLLGMSGSTPGPDVVSWREVGVGSESMEIGCCALKNACVLPYWGEEGIGFVILPSLNCDPPRQSSTASRNNWVVHGNSTNTDELFLLHSVPVRIKLHCGQKSPRSLVKW